MQSWEASTQPVAEHHARKAFLDLNTTAADSPLLSALSSSDISEVVITDNAGGIFTRADAFEVNRGFPVLSTDPQNPRQQITQEPAAAGSGLTTANGTKTASRLRELLHAIKRVTSLTIEISSPQNVEEVIRSLPDALQGLSGSMRRLTLSLPIFDTTMGASLSALIASPDSILKELCITTSAMPILQDAVCALAEALRSNVNLEVLELHNVEPTIVEDVFSILRNSIDGNVIRKGELRCTIGRIERSIGSS
jgi:hypothetical protein